MIVENIEMRHWPLPTIAKPQRAKPLDYKIRDTENKIYEMQCMLNEMFLNVEG